MAFTVERIFPTELDIGATGKGRVYAESNVSNLLKNLGRNAIVSGLTHTDNLPANRDIQIAAGNAVISGFYVSLTSTESIQTALSTWWRLYLKLTRDANSKVNGVQLDLRTDTTIPADSILLVEGRTGSTKISDSFARRLSPGGMMVGTYDTSLAENNNKITCGFQPNAVVATDGAGNSHMALSNGTAIQIEGSGTATIITYGFSVSGLLDTLIGKFVAWS